jgi:hypothetical protein
MNMDTEPIRSKTWLALVSLVVLFAVYELFSPLPPEGDEMFRVFGLAIVFSVLATLAAAVHWSPFRSAAVFSLIFLVAVLGLWFEIAAKYAYPYLGSQVAYVLVVGLVFYAVLLALSLCVHVLVKAIRRSSRAT